MRNVIVGSALLTGLASCSQPGEKQEQICPNIILVYLDDMGYGDMGRTGALGFTTPHLDQMANEGLSFTHFYSPQAVCSASRAGLLTGCYPNRLGIAWAFDHTSLTGLNPEEMTIASMLKQKDYATAVYGKWHLGHHKDFLPLNHGFDEFYGIPYSNDMWPFHPGTPNYYPPLPLFEGDSVIETNPNQADFTRDFTLRAIDFIKRQRKKPFFVYLAHPMPHVPLFVSEDFEGKSEQGLYGDVMMELDWSVGSILQTLKDLKLEKNTLVIITSDNGPWLNYGNHSGSSGGLREGKGTTFEGGQRVPAIFWWPGTIEPGKVCNRLAAGIDVLPTIAEITGADLPRKKIDGVSLLPLLKGDFEANPRKEFLYYYRQNSLQAVRSGSWKLVFEHPGRTYKGFLPGDDGIPGSANENFLFPKALYDLRRDPAEAYDVLAKYPEIAEELERIAEKARLDLGDDLKNVPGQNRREPGRVEHNPVYW
ncbi:MAG: sulfatase [Bacteroides sp.]|jgi:arylsulfatase|nr:sulfatase [Bacteroides sp.]